MLYEAQSVSARVGRGTSTHAAPSCSCNQVIALKEFHLTIHTLPRSDKSCSRECAQGLPTDVSRQPADKVNSAACTQVHANARRAAAAAARLPRVPVLDIQAL